MSLLSVSLLQGALFDRVAWLSALLPAAPDLLLGLAVVGVLAMHLALKREITSQGMRGRRMEAMLLRLREAGSAAASSAGAQRADAPAGIGEGQEFHPGPLPFAPAGPRSGMNVSRRVQALRLLRRGEDLGHIASALGVPRCEVELLVRVHRLALAAATSPERAAPAAPAPARPSSALMGA
jgi:hypothetical protein